ncbi:MAG: PEP-CTERM sorting domain-containing protein [Verrucomicrobiota bacterium]|nr:PEP-CTERM sorting domain-containing protein [Verrucomicrobiota bacterium]
MKTRILIKLTLACLCSLSQVFALDIYQSAFDSPPYTDNLSVDGLDPNFYSTAWSVSNGGGGNIVDNSDPWGTGNLVRFGGGTGGVITDNTLPVILTKNFAALRPDFVSFAMQFSIENDIGSNNDTFSFSIFNESSNLLAKVFFDNSNDRIYKTNSDAPAVRTDSGQTFVGNTIYDFEMSLNFTNNQWSARYKDTTGPLVWTDIASNEALTSGGTALNLGGMNFGWTPQAASALGNNYMLFDNVSVVVPEPSTYAMMIISLILFTGFLYRRKTKAINAD